MLLRTFSEMQLSSSRPCLWTPLLLLVSTVLLWKNVASVPACDTKNGHCEASLQELFDNAVNRSKNIRDLSTTMWYLFLARRLSSEPFHDTQLVPRSDCHTSFLAFPDTNRDFKKMQPDVLLSVTLRMVGAWNNALQHLMTKMSSVLSAPPRPAVSAFSLAKEIQKKNQELLDDLYWIRKKVYPGVQENENYPAWSEPASLQSPDEKSRFMAFYNLVECFYFDVYKIMDNLNLLRCLIIQKNNC